MTDQKTDLVGLTQEEILQSMVSHGLIKQNEKFRVKQLWHWMYHHGETDINKMTTISNELRKQISKLYKVERPKIKTVQISKDGTQKWLLKLSDDNLIETVFIPEANRGTLCVSSQVGCTLNCKFCFTGTQTVVRNLTSQEILSQLLVARDQLSDWPNTNQRVISNIVFMGMGEPLYNYDSVKQAVLIMGNNEGIKISTKKITLSTSGIVPQILNWGKEVDSRLAISLHATNDQLRNKIVPINKKYPLKELIQVCKDYPRAKNSKRITFEYVMLKGVNDATSDAKQLVKMIAGIPAKINLIPFNPWPDALYECSDKDQIKKFSDIVNNAGYASPVRKTRGQDIMAACGQLKSSSVKIKKSVRRNT